MDANLIRITATDLVTEMKEKLANETGIFFSFELFFDGNLHLYPKPHLVTEENFDKLMALQWFMPELVKAWETAETPINVFDYLKDSFRDPANFFQLVLKKTMGNGSWVMNAGGFEKCVLLDIMVVGSM